LPLDGQSQPDNDVGSVGVHIVMVSGVSRPTLLSAVGMCEKRCVMVLQPVSTGTNRPC